MSAWAKPGAKCIRIKDPLGYVNDRGFRALPALFTEVCTVASVEVDETYGVTITLAGWSKRWFQASGFRPLAYPAQSLEHDLAKFQNMGAHVRAPEEVGN